MNIHTDAARLSTLATSVQPLRHESPKVPSNPQRIDFMGCPIDALDMDQTLERIEKHIAHRRLCQHVAVNAAKFVSMQKDPDLHRIVTSCDLISADGMAVVWASQLLGTPLPGRVAGVDLFQNLVRLCAQKGYRPFFFGAREWVVQEVVNRFQAAYPDLQIAGYHNGYFTPEEEPSIARTIRKSGADMLFVAFSSPMKEKFLGRWMETMKVPFCMGVGGSFDIVAGKTKRAPGWVQRWGMEWLYRIIQEPRRMWKRYALSNPAFVWMVLKECPRAYWGRMIHGRAG